MHKAVFFLSILFLHFSCMYIYFLLSMFQVKQREPVADGPSAAASTTCGCVCGGGKTVVVEPGNIRAWCWCNNLVGWKWIYRQEPLKQTVQRKKEDKTEKKIEGERERESWWSALLHCCAHLPANPLIYDENFKLCVFIKRGGEELEEERGKKTSSKYCFGRLWLVSIISPAV